MMLLPPTKPQSGFTRQRVHVPWRRLAGPCHVIVFELPGYSNCALLQIRAVGANVTESNGSIPHDLLFQSEMPSSGMPILPVPAVPRLTVCCSRSRLVRSLHITVAVGTEELRPWERAVAIIA